MGEFQLAQRIVADPLQPLAALGHVLLRPPAAEFRAGGLQRLDQLGEGRVAAGPALQYVRSIWEDT